MPELPEVETVKRGLDRLLPGLVVVGVKHDWAKSFPNAEDDVKQFLVGAKFVGVRRRGKALMIDLSSGYTLVIHLKMTGQLVLVQRTNSSKSKVESQKSASGDETRFGAGHPNDSLVNELPDRSTRVTFDLDNGAKLFFNDQRKFGWVRLVESQKVRNIKFIENLGPEPLEDNFTAKDFGQRLSKRPNSGIKAVLLDQTIIAGVGNIYADESLWGAKIHPLTPVNKIDDRRKNLLFRELRFVLNLSIEKGGSTDRNYVDAEGKKGSYMAFARVFRREGLECPRCGTIVVKLRVAGRGTHICPKCQALH
jgi:formamidopyrimidine-DNA glycosylase